MKLIPRLKFLADRLQTGRRRHVSIHADFETFLSTWRTVETNPQTRVNAPFAATLKEDRYDQTTCTSNLLNHLSVFLCDTVSFVTRLMWGQILITAQLGRDDDDFTADYTKKHSYKCLQAPADTLSSNLLLFYIYTVLLFLLCTYRFDWYMNFTGPGVFDGIMRLMSVCGVAWSSLAGQQPCSLPHCLAR